MAVKMLTKYIDNSSNQVVDLSTISMDEEVHSGDILRNFVDNNRVTLVTTDDAHEQTIVFADIESYISYFQTLQTDSACVAENLTNCNILSQNNISQVRTVNYNYQA